MKLLDLKCNNCGASLELDLDHLQSYCPYCGNKLSVDVEDLSKVLIEKEKTKRTELQYEHQMKKLELEDSSRHKDVKEVVIAFIVLWTFIFTLIYVASKMFPD